MSEKCFSSSSCSAVLKGHEKSVFGCCCSTVERDQHTVVSVSHDQTARVWNLMFDTSPLRQRQQISEGSRAIYTHSPPELTQVSVSEFSVTQCECVTDPRSFIYMAVQGKSVVSSVRISGVLDYIQVHEISVANFEWCL